MLGQTNRQGIMAGICAVLTSFAAVRARGGELEKRLPQNGNAILIIDVTKLLDSPLGKAEGWQSKMISGYADRPLAVPATATRVAMAAFIHPANLDAIWQASLAELSSEPQIETILQTQRGYADTLGGMKAAWTPRDIYYVQLDEHTLGILRPGDRQALARWTSGKLAQPASAYLGPVISGGSNAPVVFAVDLTNSVGMGGIAYAFAAGKLPSLEKVGDGRDKLLAALGSVKGLILKMTAEQQFNAELTVDFDQSIDALGSNVKPFVIDVLKETGLFDPQVEKWEFKASGNTITGTGASSADALTRLIALMSPGDSGAVPGDVAQKPAKSNGSDPAAVPAADTAAAASPAAASQAYYRAICKIFDQMSAKSSPTQSAAWLHAQSRAIHTIPAVGVDPELMDWGDQIAQAFDKTAQVLAVGQQHAQVAVAGVGSPTASSGSWNGSQGGSTADTPESRAAFRNAQEQRRQAGAQQRALAADQALSILNEAIATRGKVRTMLVQKYNVEL
jgi:hypothetical protein